MFVIFGGYKWWPKQVAFRRDYCVHCDTEGVAFARRTWNFFHIFWIPVLPAGRSTQWHCGRCGEDPAVATSIRRPYRIMLAIILGLVLILGGFALAAEPYHSTAVSWAIRAAVVLVMLALGWWALKQDGTKEMHDRRAAVQPYAEPDCPLCGAHLGQSFEGARCTGCEAEHRPLQKKDETVALYS